MASSDDVVTAHYNCVEREYLDPERRQYGEDLTRRNFIEHLKATGKVVLDAPAGRWERVEIDSEHPPWVYWQYRLRGVVLPDVAR